MIAGGALVTGADRPIGRALALEAARRGYAVCVHPGGPGSEALLAELGPQARALSADLAFEDEARALIPRAAETLRRPLTLLINAAALNEPAGWDLQMAANLRAPILLAQAFAAQLPEAARDALVLNLIEPPQTSGHGLPEAGLLSATRSLAQALAPRVRVNALGPGPLPGKPLPVDEICAAARYLIDARAVTGQMVAVDSPD